MSILKAELGAEFDCRHFNKKVTQKVKSRLISQKRNEGVGGKTKTTRKRAEPISAKTINMLLSNYRVFMAWFIDLNDVHMDNPCKDLSVKANKRERIRRRALEKSEITKLLEYQWGHGSECLGYREDALCFTKVALYSGMRLNEIASLSLDDIKLIDDVWVFDLTSKVLKSWNSQRTVPIAQYLLDIGILEKVAKLKKQKKTYLFADVRS
jgi:site-specific recombinase XerC